MDMEARKTLSEYQFRQRGSPFYENGFGLVGDQKERFLTLKSQIHAKFQSLNKCKAETRKVLRSIGQRAIEIQKLIEVGNSRMAKHDKVSVKAVFKNCFGRRSSRIYEAIAICRAIAEGLPKSKPTTTLIRVGEKLGNPKVADKMKKVISSNYIQLEGKKKKFSKLSQQEVFKVLKSLSSNVAKPPSRSESLKSLCGQIKLLVVRAEEIQKKYDWNKTKKRNQVTIRISEVDEQIAKLIYHVRKIENELPKMAWGPNSVQKPTTSESGRKTIGNFKANVSNNSLHPG